MDKNLQSIIKIKQDEMIKAFERHNMQLTFVDNLEQLHNYLERYLCNQKTVTLGGSMTLFDTGVIDQIHQSDVVLYDRYQEGLTRDQMQEIFRKAFTSDLFITSTNALTTDGCLYNIDGNGNRVAAMIYGPKEVIVIAGKNKVFENEAEAINHIRKVSAPANAVRLNKKTPCTKKGECMDCLSPDRICSSYVKLGYQGNVGRIKIVIVDQDLGY
ncbi:lactate utilization protein [uncultured Thomasclavelia sp.]|uniref:lactate utilization protein n=1 Tax=uncultured Thomasclavelia sp. TaxID=3025759 RepID=UPI0025E314D0|nr:lactate utilization protein [uncultured Thomasclavelia sp.]